MPKVKFIVATSQNIDIDGTTFRRNPVPVILNYNYSLPPIAMATLTKEGGKIWAEADLDVKYLFATPGVGGECADSSAPKQVMKIYDIGIFAGPNQDPTIKSIAEQISEIPAVDGELIEYKLPADA